MVMTATIRMMQYTQMHGVCDEVDNNCDGLTDMMIQRLTVRPKYIYMDYDADGFGDDNSMLACTSSNFMWI